LDNINLQRLFNCPPNSIDETFVFVIMPFDKNLTNIFNTIIKDTIKSKGLRCERADDFMTNNAILSDIIGGIRKARFLIADITGYNRNVMYELGVAHALQKEVIMIYQNSTEKEKLPFDISHIRTIQYENDAIDGQKMKGR
jgi:nucleoside 2-deoxyribosyltransferase